MCSKMGLKKLYAVILAFALHGLAHFYFIFKFDLKILTHKVHFIISQVFSEFVKASFIDMMR